MTHFHSLLQGIKLCLSNSYNVFHIHMLMLLFSKFILHPEKMEVPNVKKKKKLYQISKVQHANDRKGTFFSTFHLIYSTTQVLTG